MGSTNSVGDSALKPMIMGVDCYNNNPHSMYELEGVDKYFGL